MLDAYSVDVLWIVIVGFVIAFVLAFGIGANDVANSFGTSVGSGVLSIRAACWLATFCEISGAILIGYKVSDTMRKGILEVGLYTDSEAELMLGFVSALASSALWLLVATFLKLPISGTHSIVGSTLGFSLVARGTQGVQWFTLGKIVGSWFISPVLSGIMSTALFWVIRALILNSKKPLKAGLLASPLIYGMTICINVLSIVHDGPKLLHMDNIGTWLAIIISLAIGLIVAIIVQLFVVPWQRREITSGGSNNANGSPVKFIIDESNESTPNGSLKRNRQTVSLVNSTINEETSVPAITELTELVSFNNLCGLSPTLYTTKQTFCKNGELIKSERTSDGGPIGNGTYKIDPKIIEKAERSLGNGRSLDNIDLTITSLNFIDQHWQQNGFVRSENDCKMIPCHVESPSKNHPIPLVSNSGPTTKAIDEIVIPISDTTIFSTKILSRDSNSAINNNNAPTPKIEIVESVIHMDQVRATTLSPNSSKVPLIAPKSNVTNEVDEPRDVSALFSFLQILTATFGSFAHGGNDVCNAIGPLIALWMIYKEGTVMQQSETPLFLLFFGGVGISLGLWLWGRRVIETVGNDLTKITPSTGFTIEIGAALTVLFASKIGLPISTTHCKVGSVIFVGYANAPPHTAEDKAAGLPHPKPVDWGLFHNIVYAWVVTVPIAACLSACFMLILCAIVL